MTVFLRSYRPVLAQFRSPRRATPTGLIVLHTAENLMDSIGPDTGAENVAKWMTSRTNYGSYHDLVDSDSVLQLVEYGDEAFHDGTGSNPYSLSISFALRARNWSQLDPAKREAFLRSGAQAFANQQKWLRDNGHPTTPIRRVSRDESSAGVPGFISHAERDPRRRSDPGPDFPWDEFFRYCAEAISPPETYAVKPGDTLWAIANEHDITVDQLREWNSLSGDLINPGQVLRIVAPPPPPPPPSRPTLRRGSFSKHVWDLQQVLVRDYPAYSKWRPSGYFGYKTEASVRELQRRSGLTPSGIVDESTWRALGF